MFLIVGLGNPGIEYAETRHNVGFMTADALAGAYGFGPFRQKFDGLVAEGRIGGEKICLLKPQTYMNLSGNSVVKAAHFYKILPQNIIVIHDDMDLPVGKVKAKLGGGAGGHNGLKSIDAAVTPGYNRIRIGVGHPQGGGEAVVNHVLSRFSKADAELLAADIEAVVQNIGLVIEKGVAAFSSRIGELAVKK
ncbi:MAG: aminoacyl-tRNA hydrolase [Alphaproteobacteria bacterium]|nr:aminoacyl-tRNA hydrolase [Alphaproteobacteria bacterium]